MCTEKRQQVLSLSPYCGLATGRVAGLSNQSTVATTPAQHPNDGGCTSNKLYVHFEMSLSAKCIDTIAIPDKRPTPWEAEKREPRRPPHPVYSRPAYRFILSVDKTHAVHASHVNKPKSLPKKFCQYTNTRPRKKQKVQGATTQRATVLSSCLSVIPSTC